MNESDYSERTSATLEPGGSPPSLVQGSEQKGKGKSRWRPFSSVKDKSSMQDRLLDGVLSQILPAEDFTASDAAPLGDLPTDAMRPGFNITTMSTNFRRFNARIGVVFRVEARLVRMLSWSRPSQTMSLLAVYTLICLDPYILSVIPLVVMLLGVLIPSFMTRHPDDDRDLGYRSANGPPRAPPRIVKPVKELSRDFFRNMRDLQNSMDDFSNVHDQVVDLLVPKTNFSDEAISSGLFIGGLVVAVFMSIAAHLLPWRLIFLTLGWTAIISRHPGVGQSLQQAKDELRLGNHGQQARDALRAWTRADIILDSPPEVREVEIFELQRCEDASSHGEWEGWLFSPSPYDPLSASRIAGERPQGTRYFEDIKAPEGWEWSEKKWVLDLWSREWVEERVITGVEVETEGERWVYDMFDEKVAALAHAGSSSDSRQGGDRHGLNTAASRNPRPVSGWEEGEDRESQRGEWRRRRWIRLVKRKILSNIAST